jgi:hypothetical protein
MEEVTRHSVIWVMCQCDAAAFSLQVNAKRGVLGEVFKMVRV